MESPNYIQVAMFQALMRAGAADLETATVMTGNSKRGFGGLRPPVPDSYEKAG